MGEVALLEPADGFRYAWLVRRELTVLHRCAQPSKRPCIGGLEIVPLKERLAEDVRLASAALAVNAEEAIRAITALTGEDEYRDYTVWSGPGYGQESLRLDVYIVGAVALYNYSDLGTQGTVTSWVALDGIHTAAIVTLPDSRSPLALVLYAERELARIFGRNEDMKQLEELRSNILKARLDLRAR
jgi:hypothetical protein